MSAQIVNFRPEGDHRWTADAACATYPVPNMFPADGDTRGTLAAKGVCADCPVRLECLAVALDDGEPHGVWGGLSAEERLAVRRNNTRRARVAGVEPQTGADLAAGVLDEEAAREDRAYADAKAERIADNQQAAEDFGAMLDAAADHVAQYEPAGLVSA